MSERKLNIKWAEGFVNDIYVNGFQNCEVEKTGEFYSKNLIGHYENEAYTFSDLEKRLVYVKNRYARRSFYIYNLTVLDSDYIAFHVKHLGIDLFGSKPIAIHVSVIYKIINKKVEEIWVFPALPFSIGDNGFRNEHEDITLDSLDKNFFTTLMKDFRKISDPEVPALTEREEECLFYYLRGYSAKEIAKNMTISYRTIEGHIKNIKNKYRCNNKSALRNKIFPQSFGPNTITHDKE